MGLQGEQPLRGLRAVTMPCRPQDEMSFLADVALPVDTEFAQAGIYTLIGADRPLLICQPWETRWT